MLTANQIHKSFGDNVILDSVTFNLNPADHAGLIGPNGCGKTALLRILAGIDPPDAGSVQKPNALRIRYCPRVSSFPGAKRSARTSPAPMAIFLASPRMWNGWPKRSPGRRRIKPSTPPMMKRSACSPPDRGKKY